MQVENVGWVLDAILKKNLRGAWKNKSVCMAAMRLNLGLKKYKQERSTDMKLYERERICRPRVEWSSLT